MNRWGDCSDHDALPDALSVPGCHARAGRRPERRLRPSVALLAAAPDEAVADYDDAYFEAAAVEGARAEQRPPAALRSPPIPDPRNHASAARDGAASKGQYRPSSASIAAGIQCSRGPAHDDRCSPTTRLVGANRYDGSHVLPRSHANEGAHRIARVTPHLPCHATRAHLAIRPAGRAARTLPPNRRSACSPVPVPQPCRGGACSHAGSRFPCAHSSE